MQGKNRTLGGRVIKQEVKYDAWKIPASLEEEPQFSTNSSKKEENSSSSYAGFLPLRLESFAYNLKPAAAKFHTVALHFAQFEENHQIGSEDGGVEEDSFEYVLGPDGDEEEVTCTSLRGNEGGERYSGVLTDSNNNASAVRSSPQDRGDAHTRLDRWLLRHDLPIPRAELSEGSSQREDKTDKGRSSVYMLNKYPSQEDSARIGGCTFQGVALSQRLVGGQAGELVNHRENEASMAELAKPPLHSEGLANVSTVQEHQEMRLRRDIEDGLMEEEKLDDRQQRIFSPFSFSSANSTYATPANTRSGLPGEAINRSDFMFLHGGESSGNLILGERSDSGNTFFESILPNPPGKSPSSRGLDDGKTGVDESSKVERSPGSKYSSQLIGGGRWREDHLQSKGSVENSMLRHSHFPQSTDYEDGRWRASLKASSHHHLQVDNDEGDKETANIAGDESSNFSTKTFPSSTLENTKEETPVASSASMIAADSEKESFLKMNAQESLPRWGAGGLIRSTEQGGATSLETTAKDSDFDLARGGGTSSTSTRGGGGALLLDPGDIFPIPPLVPMMLQHNSQESEVGGFFTSVSPNNPPLLNEGGETFGASSSWERWRAPPPYEVKFSASQGDSQQLHPSHPFPPPSSMQHVSHVDGRSAPSPLNINSMLRTQPSKSTHPSFMMHSQGNIMPIKEETLTLQDCVLGEGKYTMSYAPPSICLNTASGSDSKPSTEVVMRGSSNPSIYLHSSLGGFTNEAKLEGQMASQAASSSASQGGSNYESLSLLPEETLKPLSPSPLSFSSLTPSDEQHTEQLSSSFREVEDRQPHYSLLHPSPQPLYEADPAKVHLETLQRNGGYLSFSSMGGGSGAVERRRDPPPPGFLSCIEGESEVVLLKENSKANESSGGKFYSATHKKGSLSCNILEDYSSTPLPTDASQEDSGGGLHLGKGKGGVEEWEAENYRPSLNSYSYISRFPLLGKRRMQLQPSRSHSKRLHVGGYASGRGDLLPPLPHLVHPHTVNDGFISNLYTELYGYGCGVYPVFYDYLRNFGGVLKTLKEFERGYASKRRRLRQHTYDDKLRVEGNFDFDKPFKAYFFDDSPTSYYSVDEVIDSLLPYHLHHVKDFYIEKEHPEDEEVTKQRKEVTTAITQEILRIKSLAVDYASPFASWPCYRVIYEGLKHSVDELGRKVMELQANSQLSAEENSGDESLSCIDSRPQDAKSSPERLNEVSGALPSESEQSTHKSLSSLRNFPLHRHFETSRHEVGYWRNPQLTEGGGV